MSYRSEIAAEMREMRARGGRPPKATEWVRSDPDNDYPSFGSVYRGRGHENNPFASWAEAVEAAGFERPGAGYYERTPEILRRQSEAQRRRWARRRTAA